MQNAYLEAYLKNVVQTYLMDKDINRFIQRHSLSIGHGQEAEAHTHVKPLTHAFPVRLFFGARSLIFLHLTYSCIEK